MLFNSIGFAIFLPIIFTLYWLLSSKGVSVQNLLLLIASYLFYSFWDWRFLFLLIFSTLLDYFTALKIFHSRENIRKKFWLSLSIAVNLGFLGFFKYYNFFVHSFAILVSHFGLRVSPWTLQIILPVGISFYTFHGLSYIIDIYNKKIQPERNFINYSLFVSFFPLLVAGPIERATHLLPQLKSKKKFNYTQAVDGLRQILWGLFKKIVIADQCAVYANLIFSHGTYYSGSTIALGALFFTFQIYGDFSGYSDIALGVARLLGIELLRNFAYPYFSRDIAEFWRRWHISLSSWFRDYVYIPLGGSRAGFLKSIRNVMIIFLLSGFWHGANWTFIAWGLLNAIYIMPSIFLKTNRNNLDIVAQGRQFPSLKECIAMATTFVLTVLAWIFFRAESLNDAYIFISKIFSRSLFKVPYFPGIGLSFALYFFILIFLIIEWRGREYNYAIENLELKWPRTVRWSFYCAVVLVTYYFALGVPNIPFIYFQF